MRLISKDSAADQAARTDRPGRAIAAVAFLTGLVVVVFGFAAWEDVHDEFATRGATITSLAARSTRLFYRQFEDTLGGLATEIAEERLLDNPMGAQRALERTNATFQGLHALCLVDASGRLVAEVMDAGIDGVGPIAADAIRGAGSRLEVGRPVAGRKGGAWVVPMRLKSDEGAGRRQFSLLAVTEVDDQWRLLSDLVIPQGWVIGMRRDDASLQARWPMPEDPAAMFGRSLPGPMARVLQEQPGLRAGTVTGVSPIDGTTRMFVFQRVADYPFAMFVSIPRQALWLAWFDRMRLPVTLFVLLAIGGLWGHRRLATQQLRHAAELQKRVASYQRLAEISSDWFWETDAEHRFRWQEEHTWHPTVMQLGLNRYEGFRRWEVPGSRFDPDLLRRHIALLDRHEPFRDFEYERDADDGEVHHLSVSGAPVFAEDGRLAGYRGMGRDITLRKRAEHALRASESVFSAVFAGSRDALFLGDVVSGRIFDCNPRAVALFEASDREHLTAMSGDALLARRLPRRELVRVFSRLASGLGVRQDYQYRTCRGRVFWGETVVARLDVQDAPMHLVRVADVSERKQAEALLRHSEQRFRDLSEMASDWFWEQDADLRFTDVLTAPPGAVTDWRERAVGRRRWELEVILDLDDPKWEEHRRHVARRLPFRDFVFCYRGRDGVHWASISGKPVFDERGEFAGYRGTGRDITERKAAEEQIRFLAQHDGLTGLPNRISLQGALAGALERVRRHGRRLAVMFIDLDRFKLVNDTLGHSAGDLVLRDVARRLEACLRSVDIVARQGGDEFVVLVEDYHTEADLAGVATKLLDACAEPFVIEGQEFALSGSIGIGTYPGDGADIETLLKVADIAMYRAKESGRNRYEFYAPHLATHPPERLSMETALKRAVERGELRLLYQPKLEISTGVVAGAEALVRWEHPELGLLQPAQFIPIAEESGLVVPLGHWVLAEASRQLRLWHDDGLRDLTMAVNVSARQFVQGRLLLDVVDALERASLLPGSVELEITESTVMRNPAHAAALLAALDELGVGIAIDDFGTGYSSLAYLKRFPVDTLKIDRSFIQDLPDDAEDVAITQAVLALARSLRLRVVAEGVEMPRQLVFLAAHGCDFAQGFSIARPLSADAFAAFVRDLESPSRKTG